MTIKSTDTNTLFKAKAFWNGFGFFATYEHATLLRDAVSGYMNAHIQEVSKLQKFEDNLKEAIVFVRKIQENKESPLEKEIGEEIDNINIHNNVQTYKLVDLENENTLNFLEQSQDMPKHEMRSVLEKILALKQMRDAMDEVLNEGVNVFDKETELKVVEEVLHHHFDLNNLDDLLEEARKEPLTEEDLQRTLKEALSFARASEGSPNHPFYEIIFRMVKEEKEKLPE